MWRRSDPVDARHKLNVQDVFWMSYLRSIYSLCLRGNIVAFWICQSWAGFWICQAYEKTRILNNVSVSEYDRFLNELGIQIYYSYTGFWIEGFIEKTTHNPEYATGSEYVRGLNALDSKLVGSSSSFLLVQNGALEFWHNGT